MPETALDGIPVDPRLFDLYQDLHQHPELGFQEHRTAGVVADGLTATGWEVTSGVGGTGVVGVLRNGGGPTVMLRADMDGLPVEEDTGLAYASTATGTDGQGRSVPVSHTCGHDLHTTCLLGGTDPALFTTGDMTDPALRSVPSNHSPHFAPALGAALPVGVTALVLAARTWLARG